MRLTRYTDFALRVLIHLATQPDRHASIASIARSHRISHNHLMKVVHDLGKAGFVASVRGRSGGIRLARPAEAITVGAVVRHTEEDFRLADCDNCVISPACSLVPVLDDALRAFLDVLDGVTLADLVARRGEAMRALLAKSEASVLLSGDVADAA